jgi:tRNA dimethylallyltransferase
MRLRASFGRLPPVTLRRPAIIAGPTASGKSALGLAVAQRDGGCVINADALQVYSCWNVLTARPDASALARAPHELYGHVPGDRRYSVGDWLRDLEPVLDRCAASGLRPVIVGGTGLYLSALTEGLADIPPVPPAVRAESAALIARGRIDRLQEDLATGDPDTFCRIDRDNPMRLQRAWEVLRATGRPLSDWQRTTPEPLLPVDAADCLVLEISPSNNNKLIASRFEKMVECGALEETRAFIASSVPRDAPVACALGAAPLIEHLENGLPLEAAIAAAATATRQYSKRQRTWFRNRMTDWLRVDPAGDALAAVRAA